MPDASPLTPEFSSDAWRAWEPERDRFEDAWQKGKQPEMEHFLPQQPPLWQVLDLALLDLEYRLKQGQQARVEQYLARFPVLAERGEAVLQLAQTEYDFRQRQEEVNTAEYHLRFAKLTGRPEWIQWLGGKPRFPVVAGYEVLEELGRGAMGIVYKARHLKLNRIVALKMLRFTRVDEEEMARIRREAEAVAQLQHANIVHIYDIGEAEGQPFLSLEYVDGGTLARKLTQERLSLREIIRLMGTLAEAVHHAHERRIIHRDLKPANILLTREGRPKITDFGLAKRLDGPGGTQSGVIMGTPSYMSPEQAWGRKVGPATDVYSLGAILYQLLTGRPPFQGDTVEVIHRIRNEEAAPPRRWQPELSMDLERICLTCLRKEPAQRYDPAVRLAEALNHLDIDDHLGPPKRKLKVEVAEANVLFFEADVLALKYAQRYCEVDRHVAGVLDLSELPRQLSAPGTSLLLETRNRLTAPRLLYVAVEPLREFGYASIREFAGRVLSALKDQAPETRHLAVTMQGANMGLDEREALSAQLRGFLENYKQGNAPPHLERITFVEYHKARAVRMHETLQLLLPGEDVDTLPPSAGKGAEGKRRVLVVLPAAEELSDVYYYGIQRPVQEAGYLCERADTRSVSAETIEWIKQRNAAASLIIVDMSRPDPNVHLIVGYLLGLGRQRPTVLLVGDSSDLKFQLPKQKCLVYNPKRIQDLEKHVKNELGHMTFSSP
jgi:serine/threonine protein kinase